MKANKILITILLFLAMLISVEACVDCDTYIFLTAAIDGPSFDADGSYIYLNPCTIDVDGVTKTGIPGAAFEVTSNKVHIITYSKESPCHGGSENEQAACQHDILSIAKDKARPKQL